MTVLNSSKISTGLPQHPESWPKELFSQALTVYNAIANLSAALSLYAGVDPQPSDYWSQLSVSSVIYDGNMNRFYPVADENIAYGALVAPVISGTTIHIRNANATDNTRWACGVCNQVGGILAGAQGECIGLRGLLQGITGLTPGARYFTSTVNGLVVAAEPIAAGNIGQCVGFALGADRFWLDINLQFVQH